MTRGTWKSAAQCQGSVCTVRVMHDQLTNARQQPYANTQARDQTLSPVHTIVVYSVYSGSMPMRPSFLCPCDHDHRKAQNSLDGCFRLVDFPQNGRRCVVHIRALALALTLILAPHSASNQLVSLCRRSVRLCVVTANRTRAMKGLKKIE